MDIQEIWRKDAHVATIHNNQVIEHTINAPILIKKGQVADWKAIRTQDLNRPNSRALRRLLGLSTSNPQDVSPVIYYQSLSDAFWLKNQGDTTQWSDIGFSDDRFFSITLTGKGHMSNPRIFDSPYSPEHSNTGSFEKGWKRTINGWQLWKNGSPEAVWSEVFYSQLANLIFQDCAVNYWESDGFSVCDSFIDREQSECLEPFYSFCDSHDNAETALAVLPAETHTDYVNMLFLDALMYNWDRHEFNFGVITKPDSQTVRLQPYYDFNLSLFNGAEPTSIRFEDTTIKMYKQVCGAVPYLTDDMVKEAYALTSTSFAPVASLTDTLSFIMQSYQLIKSS